MPDPRIKVKDIFKESNRLLLTKSLLFQDTTKIEGSYFTNEIQRGLRRFFGYVYRYTRDDNDVPYVFENGLSTAEYDIESGEPTSYGFHRHGKTYGFRLTDLSTLTDLKGGIVTHICCYQTLCSQLICSSVYLIDIRELGGIVRREPWIRYDDAIVPQSNIPACPHDDIDGQAFVRFPVNEEVFDVVIMYPVSKSRIVGVIKTFPLSKRSLHSQQLKLYVNPNYTGGMEGAMAVAASFNGESEWEMVDA